MEHPIDVYSDETPTELHHQDCDDTPDSYPSGDATWDVARDPDHYAVDGETMDVSCECLDDGLGRGDA